MVLDLKTLVAFLDRPRQGEHGLLLFRADVLGVGNGEMVVHVEVAPALQAPGLERIGEGGLAGILAPNQD